MKDLSKEATYLIKQGDKLFWKNPYYEPLRDDYGTTVSGSRKWVKDYGVWEDFKAFSEANPIHAIGDWPDKEEFSREEVEIVPQCFDYEFNEWQVLRNPIERFEDLKRLYRSVRLAARYKGEIKQYCGCDFVMIMRHHETDIAYCSECGREVDESTSKEQPADINAGQSEEECKHEPLIDTGVGYYHCPACNKGWTYEEYKSLPEDVSNLINLLDYESSKVTGLNWFDLKQSNLWHRFHQNIIENAMKAYKEQFRAEVINKLEAERDNIKKYISPGESSYTLFSFSVRAYEKAIEIVKETQIK